MPGATEADAMEDCHIFSYAGHVDRADSTSLDAVTCRLSAPAVSNVTNMCGSGHTHINVCGIYP